MDSGVVRETAGLLAIQVASVVAKQDRNKMEKVGQAKIQTQRQNQGGDPPRRICRRAGRRGLQQ